MTTLYKQYSPNFLILSTPFNCFFIIIQITFLQSIYLAVYFIFISFPTGIRGEVYGIPP